MRVLGRPVLRLAATVAALVFAVAIVAGAVRLLPLAFAPDVPGALVPPLAAGVALVGVELALFVAPPVAFAVAAGMLVARGDFRGLAALGVGPRRLVASSWPIIAALAAASACASFTWGRSAAAPGDAMAALVARGREACARPTSPRAIAVPLTGVSWACFPSEAPRAIVAASGGVVTASALALSPDARSLHGRDVTLSLGGAAPITIRAADADVRGIAGLGAGASNLTAAARAALFALTVALLSVLAAFAVLSRALVGLRAAMVGVGAPAAALLVFSSLERAPAPAAAYVSVPVAGLAALVAISLAASARVKRSPR